MLTMHKAKLAIIVTSTCNNTFEDESLLFSNEALYGLKLVRKMTVLESLYRKKPFHLTWHLFITLIYLAA